MKTVTLKKAYQKSDFVVSDVHADVSAWFCVRLCKHSEDRFLDQVVLVYTENDFT